MLWVSQEMRMNLVWCGVCRKTKAKWMRLNHRRNARKTSAVRCFFSICFSSHSVRVGVFAVQRIHLPPAKQSRHLDVWEWAGASERVITSLTKHEFCFFYLEFFIHSFGFAMKDACDCYGVALVWLIHKAMSILSSRLRFFLRFLLLLLWNSSSDRTVFVELWNIFIIFHFIQTNCLVALRGIALTFDNA